MTENTTASGAADLTKQGATLLGQLIDIFDDQQNNAPEHREYVPEAWDATLTEARALIAKIDSLAASAPVAPTQAASKRLIGWRTPDYLEETADAAIAKNWSVHHDLLPIFEGDVHTKLATPQAAPVAPAPQPAPLTSSFVQTVPDKCDRIVWRNNYYHLPITQPAPLQQGEYLPQQDSDAPASLGAYLAAWAGGVHSRTKNDTGAAEDWISVPVERLGHAAAALIAARGAAQAAPAPVAEDAEIRKALHGAATSLETISRIAGKDPYMLEMVDVRIYAASRAKVARDAHAAQPEGGAK